MVLLVVVATSATPRKEQQAPGCPRRPCWPSPALRPRAVWHRHHAPTHGARREGQDRRRGFGTPGQGRGQRRGHRQAAAKPSAPFGPRDRLLVRRRRLLYAPSYQLHRHPSPQRPLRRRSEHHPLRQRGPDRWAGQLPGGRHRYRRRVAPRGTRKRPYRSERNALVVDLYFESRREGEHFAAKGPKFASITWSRPGSVVTNDPASSPGSFVASGDIPGRSKDL